MLAEAADIMKERYDLKRSIVTFSVGDQVLLSFKESPHFTKTSPRWIGPFLIKQTLPFDDYLLDLPVNLRIHPVFHVSRLKLYRPPYAGQPHSSQSNSFTLDGHQHWLVNKIIDHRFVRNRPQFRVNWLGWSSDYDSWEPLSSFENTSAALYEYLDLLPANRQFPLPPDTPPRM